MLAIFRSSFCSSLVGQLDFITSSSTFISASWSDTTECRNTSSPCLLEERSRLELGGDVPGDVTLFLLLVSSPENIVKQVCVTSLRIFQVNVLSQWTMFGCFISCLLIFSFQIRLPHIATRFNRTIFPFTITSSYKTLQSTRNSRLHSM